MATPQVSQSRTVKVFKLFTADGEAVFYDFAGWTLIATPGKQVRAIETLTHFDIIRLRRAAEALRCHCEWRDAGTTEVMDVAF